MRRKQSEAYNEFSVLMVAQMGIELPAIAETDAEVQAISKEKKLPAKLAKSVLAYRRAKRKIEISHPELIATLSVR